MVMEAKEDIGGLEGELIPELPDNTAVECLARVRTSACVACPADDAAQSGLAPLEPRRTSSSSSKPRPRAATGRGRRRNARWRWQT